MRKLPEGSKYNFPKRKKKSIFFEIHFAFSTVLWRSLQGSDHRTWIMDLSFEMWRNTSKRLGSDCSQDFARCADQWTIWEKVSSFLLLVGAFPRLYQNKVLMHNTSFWKHMSYQVQSMNSLLSTVTIMSTVMCVKHKKPLEGNHCVIDSFSSYSL